MFFFRDGMSRTDDCAPAARVTHLGKEKDTVFEDRESAVSAECSAFTAQIAGMRVDFGDAGLHRNTTRFTREVQMKIGFFRITIHKGDTFVLRQHISQICGDHRFSRPAFSACDGDLHIT